MMMMIIIIMIIIIMIIIIINTLFRQGSTEKPLANKLVALFDVQIELEFRGVGFCGGRKPGEPREKPSEQGENQQQTQPTRGGEYGNRTRITEVGLGRALIDCANHAPT